MKRTKFKKCNCGCGDHVSSKNARFIKGHNFKIALSIEIEKKRREKIKKTMLQYFTNHPEAIEKIRSESTGRLHSEETKKKLSISNSGNGNGMFGKIHSKEAKDKISEAGKGRIFSEETRKKIGDKNSKKTRSVELRKRISNSLKEHFKENQGTFKNKKHSDASKEKMRIANIGKFRGEKGPNWQGGLSSYPYATGWTPWKIREIRNRDENKCQNPKCENPHELLDVHHINYDKQNHTNENLITLCKRCHGKTQKRRAFWIEYYQKIMKQRKED